MTSTTSDQAIENLRELCASIERQDPEAALRTGNGCEICALMADRTLGVPRR